MYGYDHNLKRRMDLNIFSMNRILNELGDEKRIYMVRYSEIAKCIKQLPQDIQKNIYIFSMKMYWRRKLLNSPLIPLHIQYNSYLIEQRKKLVMENVHFLHLDFNTLPGKKKFILGCQCDFCYQYPKEKKEELYRRVNGDTSSFLKTINADYLSFGNGVVSPNDYDDYEYTSYVRDFNFKKDSLMV